MDTTDYRIYCEEIEDEDERNALLELPETVREFLGAVQTVQFLRPQRPEECMTVEVFPSWEGALDAAVQAHRDGVNPAWTAALDAAEDAARDAGRGEAYEAASDAAHSLTRRAAERAARHVTASPCNVTATLPRDAAWCAGAAAAAYAAALTVADIVDVDITPLHKRWSAWQRGFVPLREEGDTLVVGCALHTPVPTDPSAHPSAEEFRDSILAAHILRPQTPEEWMTVQESNGPWADVLKAAIAGRHTDWQAANHAAWVAACITGRDAAYHAAWEAASEFAEHAVWQASRHLTEGDLGGDDRLTTFRQATWAAAACAAAYAAALTVADLVDISALQRWWAAWERGFVPVSEDGDSLVVGCPIFIEQPD